MKRLFSITSVLLLAFGMAVAQDTTTPPSGEQPAQPVPGQEQMSDETTLRGCLSGTENEFTLTDQSGQSYRLGGNISTLNEHIGKEVEISGSLHEAPMAGDPTGEQAGAATTGDERFFHVNNVQVVADSCEAARPEADPMTEPETEVEPQPETEAVPPTDPDAAATATDPNAVVADPNATAETQPDVEQESDIEAAGQEVAEETQQAGEAVAEAGEEAVEETEQALTQDQGVQEETDMGEQLPQTASPLPFLALVGFGSLLAGLWSRRK